MNDFSFLLSLTELYLHQEHRLSDRIATDQETYTFFKDFARTLPQKTSLPPPLKESESPLQTMLKIPSPPPTFEPKKEPSPQEVPISSKSSVINEKKPLIQSETIQTSTPHYQSLRNLHPHVKWVELPPNDDKATEVCQKWKEKQNLIEVLLISDGQGEQHSFLIKIAAAIKKYGKSAAVLEIPNAISHFQPTLVIGSRLLFSKHPEIREHYTKCAEMIDIGNMTETMKSQELKRVLWDQITKHLKIEKHS